MVKMGLKVKNSHLSKRMAEIKGSHITENEINRLCELGRYSVGSPNNIFSKTRPLFPFEIRDILGKEFGHKLSTNYIKKILLREKLRVEYDFNKTNKSYIFHPDYKISDFKYALELLRKGKKPLVVLREISARRMGYEISLLRARGA